MLLTKDDICFSRGFLQGLEIVQATEHRLDRGVGFLDCVCFRLGPDKRGVLVFWVLLVKCVKGIARNVPCNSSTVECKG